jgi:hypothetical protein
MLPIPIQTFIIPIVVGWRLGAGKQRPSMCLGTSAMNFSACARIRGFFAALGS